LSEYYGRSPGMEALAELREAQVLDHRDLELMASDDEEISAAAKKRFYERRYGLWHLMGLI
jgi:acetylornithine deacetylase/succinyl-diaminopimelate desuccinylase-like protein